MHMLNHSQVHILAIKSKGHHLFSCCKLPETYLQGSFQSFLGAVAPTLPSGVDLYIVHTQALKIAALTSLGLCWFWLRAHMS